MALLNFFHIVLLSSSFLFFLLINRALSATFTINNNCDYTVWPGILSGAGTAPLSTTGFMLARGGSRPVAVPASWSGRVWARTLCTSTGGSSNFTCATGDCGTSALECSGSGAAPPATLAEFTLNGSGGLDFYDVSLVDGYNLPVLVVPQGGSGGNCSSTGCLMDLNPVCPSDLKVGKGAAVACRSACEAFGTAEYCCSGDHGSPSTCRPSAYSQFFKNACPRAYSYAYDDSTSTFTCAAGADYVITFCPSTTSQKSGQQGSNSTTTAGPPVVNETMVFLGGDEFGDGSMAVPPSSSVTSLLALGASCLLLLLLWA